MEGMINMFYLGLGIGLMIGGSIGALLIGLIIGGKND